MNAHDKLVYDVFYQCLKPASDEGIIEFAEKYVKFPHSDRAPMFKASLAPWLVEPLKELTDNANDFVVCRASVGSSKTTMFETALPYILAQDPGPTMVITQTDDDTRDWVDTRLTNVLKSCAPVAELWPRERGRIRKETMIFPHMPIFFGGASLSNLQSKSIRWCLGDEVWRWPPGMLDEFKGRRHDRWNARMFLVSQGGEEGDDFSTAFADTDQRVRHWQCTDCGQRHPYSLYDLKWDDFWIDDEEGGEMDYKRIAESARMQCPNPSCEKVYRDLPRVRYQLSLHAKYIAKNPNALKGMVGFWWNVLSVYWVPWGNLVIEWLKAMRAKSNGNDVPMWTFRQKRLGEDKTFTDDVQRPELAGSDYSLQELVPGELSEHYRFRYLTVDKQLNHYWVVIREWSPGGDSRLLFVGRVESDDDIRELQLRYKIPDKFVGIDAQYETTEVYKLCARYGWLALHGSGQADFAHYEGKKRRRRMVKRFTSKLSRVSVGAQKFAFRMHWSNERIKDVLFAFRIGRAGDWRLPFDLPQFYFKQIDSEVKKRTINKNTKQIEERWIRVYKHNHIWDCECMQVVFAYSSGLIDDFSLEEVSEEEPAAQDPGDDDDV